MPRNWCWGFILAGVFFLGFSLGYPLAILTDPGLGELITHNPLLKLFATVILVIGVMGLRQNNSSLNQQGNKDRP